jgi:hypothetical protein
MGNLQVQPSLRSAWDDKNDEFLPKTDFKEVTSLAMNGPN